jgi:ferric-dicitrate binding protein FerR (iron transport regulator)
MSGAERAEFQRTLDTDARARSELDTLRQLWDQSAGLSLPWDSERFLVRVRRAAAGDRAVLPGRPTRRLPVPTARTGLLVAAGLAAAVLIAVSVRPGERARVRQRHVAVDSTVLLRALPGQRLVGRLPDGTEVQLAAGSVLSRSSAYGTVDRRVWLDGVAYFNVRKNNAHPFLVLTADAVTRDIGTKFVVRRRSGDSRTQVVVTEGSVAISARRPGDTLRATGSSADVQPPSNRELVLTVADLGVVSETGTVTLTPRVPVADYADWTAGRLRFADTPLVDAVAELSAWYGVPVSVASPELRRVRVSGVFDTESAAEVAEMLAASINARVTRDDGTLSIRSSGADTTPRSRK